MTFSILTMATPQQIAEFHAGGRKAKAKPKKYKPKPQMVEQLTRWAVDGSWVELQLPVLVKSVQANGTFFMRAADSARVIKLVLPALRSMLRGIDREAVVGLTYTRIHVEQSDGLDEDNLPGAFKPALDATAVWILKGNEDFKQKGIGSWDGKLKKLWKEQGKTWPPTYEQTTHETDKRRQGIRIRLQLSSKSAAPTKP